MLLGTSAEVLAAMPVQLALEARHCEQQGNCLSHYGGKGQHVGSFGEVLSSSSGRYFAHVTND